MIKSRGVDEEVERRERARSVVSLVFGEQ